LSKVNLPPISANLNAVTKINQNFDRIEEGFDNTLSRDGSSPNEMLSQLNMNHNRIRNVGDAVNAKDAVNLAQAQSLSGPKGDPGGNVTSVGLFNDLSNYEIGEGTDNIRTSGFSESGKGAAFYFYDEDVDEDYVDNNPLTSFIDQNGRGFKLSLEQFITPYMFGAKGDGSTDDTDAIEAAASLGIKLYFTGTFGITSGLTFTAGIEGSEGATIKALAPMAVMATFQGGATGYLAANLRVAGITFNGNALATDGICPIAMKGSLFERVVVRGVKRDGLRPLAASDNNNTISFRNCVFKENGTVINAGTAFFNGINYISTPARCSASGTSVTISGAVPSTFDIEVGKDIIWVEGYDPSMITAVAGQILTVSPALPSIPANTKFTIFKGSGMNIARGSDNNVWEIANCIFLANSTAGLMDFSLYGAQGRGNLFEGNGCYGKIQGSSELVFSSTSTGEYSEFNGAGSEWVKNGAYYTVHDPVPASSEGIRVTIGLVSFDGAVTAEASKAVHNPVNYPVMEATLYVTYYVKTLIVTMTNDGSVIIPNAPLNPTLPETFTIHMANTNNKTLLVKTTDDATLVNGSPGLTGYPFSGSNRTLTFRWDGLNNGWTVSASGVDEASTTPSLGTWAIGRKVYNSVPTAGGNIGWGMTASGWKTFGTLAA